MSDDLSSVLARVERARRRKLPLRESVVTLGHGSGGKTSRSLVEGIFLEALSNPLLDPLEDQAILSIGGARLAFMTDSYVVDPIFFPGGDIGRLAVNGTVNDLATSGAGPLYLSLAVILEKGFPIADLRRITASIAEAAREAGVQVVTGDTKVAPRGKIDRISINTAGIGVIRRERPLSTADARPGDRVLISGPVADHGVTVLAARGELELELDTASDTAPLSGLVEVILTAGEVHCLKDPTRGGIATALNEIALQSGVGIVLKERAIPVRPDVRAACEILGIDPSHLANEGKLLVIVPAEHAERALSPMREHPYGAAARLIGEVVADPVGMVLLHTDIGLTSCGHAGGPVPPAHLLGKLPHPAVTACRYPSSHLDSGDSSPAG